jgi:hypothetical protein
MGQFLLPRITTIDRELLTLEISEAVFDVNTNTPWFGDGVTVGGIEWTGGGGGTALTEDIITVNGNITAVPNSRMFIPDALMTESRNIDLSALTDGDVIEIYNFETHFTHVFTGTNPVYRYTDIITDLDGGVTYKLAMVGGKLLQ